eukprot:c130_g1_i1.p1 GENE.c130_g1_i1~~c130_g1_i1.p1  ORF type:complete len:132 (+),score=18.32 c130_g1_i1:3-398(+)
MDMMAGGDLKYQLGVMKRFGEQKTKFYAAEIILGVCFLHQSEILHRDIKPSNVMFDGEGHMRLADLGLAVECRQGQIISGTAAHPVTSLPKSSKLENLLFYRTGGLWEWCYWKWYSDSIHSAATLRSPQTS